MVPRFHCLALSSPSFSTNFLNNIHKVIVFHSVSFISSILLFFFIFWSSIDTQRISLLIDFRPKIIQDFLPNVNRLCELAFFFVAVTIRSPAYRNYFAKILWFVLTVLPFVDLLVILTMSYMPVINSKGLEIETCLIPW